MLPPQFQQQYAHFQQQLTALQQQLAQPDRDPIPVKPAVTQLQLFFQSVLWQRHADEFPPQIGHLVQSYQVEIDKQLRLLSLDATFLQAARQPTTIAQRQQQMDDRLQMLLRYCEAVMHAGAPAEE